MTSGDKLFSAQILSQVAIAPGFQLLSIHAPNTFVESTPGQFLMIRSEGVMFLPRPISIHSVYKKSGRVVCELLYQVVGRGTARLSEMKKGDALLVHGPLGKGFDLNGLPEKVVLVGGGMGIAPLKYTAQTLKRLSPEKSVICYQGSRCKSLLPDVSGLTEICSQLWLCTDDGSIGRKGFVTQLLAEDLGAYHDQDTAILACGPLGMIRSLNKLISGRRMQCQVSIEERMACGVGACLGCAIQAAKGGYFCACKDGPVFNLEELALDHAE